MNHLDLKCVYPALKNIWQQPASGGFSVTSPAMMVALVETLCDCLGGESLWAGASLFDGRQRYPGTRITPALFLVDVLARK